MAEGNEELLRGMFDAFNAGGVEETLAYLDPELVWTAPPEWLEQRVYRGHDGIRELSSYWTENFEQYRLDLERVFELDDDRAAVLLYQRGWVKDSDTEIEQAVGYVVEVAEGKLTRVDVYFSWDATLEAAGLKE